MEDKVISRSSNKVVVRKKVPLGDVDWEPVIGTGMMSSVVSLLAVGMPLNVIADLPMGLSLLSAAGAAMTATGFSFSLMYAQDVASESDSYSGSDVSFWKVLAGVMFPLGQKPLTGISRVKVNQKTELMNKLEYAPRSVSKEVTHEISSRIKFTPVGAYIEQEFNASPVALWDDAFDTTKEVHRFKTNGCQSGE